MAEAVGLTLGIVSLAGTFKGCIDLFDYISASRSLGLDYELLDTKLDVEKALLLQWATRVGLLAEHPDARLDQPNVCRAISRVLAGIQLLLSDSQTLQGRYGMRAFGTSHAANSIATFSGASLTKHTLSDRRMGRFINDFKRLSVRAARLQEAVPVAHKIRWAIHDKEKFEGLIDQLSYFVSKLNDIVPDSTGALGPMMREDLGGLHDNRLRMIIQACIGREELMAASAEKVMDKRCTDRILQLFWYRVMDDRRTSLADAHSSTFKWALESPNQHTESQWDDISGWLKHGSGIYWISGKAGSGKSTLMKYLYGHRKTYVESTIGSHPYMQQLALAESYADTEESSPAAQIIDELVSKASGVFLWVILACRSLIEGFAAYDNIEELRKRVDELPPELEDLFQHMLNKIDPRYQVEAAKILRICYQNQLDGIKLLPSVGLAIVDELGMDPRRVPPPRKLSDAEKRAKCQFLEGRLRSRCCGLLEISRPCAESVEYDCFCNADGLFDTHNWLIDSRIQFMHRTVFDFLSQPGVWDIKYLQVQDPDFDADSVLSWVFMELLALCGQRRNTDNWKYLKHALVHALRADSLAPRAIVPVLSRLDQILQNILRDRPASLPFASELSDPLYDFRNHFPFALFAAETGMVNYVRYCTESVISLQNRAYTLLYHALRSPYIACLKSWELGPSAEMIHSSRETNLLLEVAEITKELLQAGAHVDAGEDFTEGELVETIETYFVDCRNSPEAEAEEIAELREKGLELLRMIEDRQSGSTAGECLPCWDAQGTSRDARVSAGSKRPCDVDYDGFAKRPRPV
ncbi:hypothetical protein DL766_000327 [Monosporascus sp. MC13-8B]|uniref:Prion-inhibition and propagation HeLo domain-containing protein n=1 Tax=Monosporascus cannonballus TaxID=155416 RepID=A0ABY0GYX3_9PEZI|nr:hypothetical protein DL762_007524 [Monosporascus cannonballus]RYP00013.1 hypothetical protein DL763_001143 [Monosporascus cannonballus]RYP39505.1 hypothetical protein DL766_000327 [Monosporascus sp. MC13-8B]